jgi:putative RNA 2'-phosphotransferase
MSANQLKSVSKSLSYVLRHRPDAMGLELKDGGWVEVDELLAAFKRSGKELTLLLLKEVVADSDKQRFEFSADGAQIRARQGHSAEVELGYEPTQPPEVLYHGTATRFLDSILAQGLVKGERHHVHLSTNKETMVQVGMRHGKPVLLAVDAARMQRDGHEFFVTGNNVWLTDHVPPTYLTVMEL